MSKLLIIVALAMVLLLSSCQYVTGDFPATTSTAAATTEPAFLIESGLPFEIHVSASEDGYLPGESIIFGIGIVNLSAGTITIDPFSPASQILRVDGGEVVRSEAAGNRTYDIEASGPFLPTKDFWDQKDQNGKQVPPGWYELTYEYVIVEHSTSTKYTVYPTARFQIVYPRSAMTKDLAPELSVTANGLAATLERIELTAVGGEVYVFTTPPGYTLPQPEQPGRLEGLSAFVMGSAAEYSIDGGRAKGPVDVRAQFNESGATLIWKIEPIPLDVQELTFIVTKLGEREGRWEFKIPFD